MSNRSILPIAGLLVVGLAVAAVFFIFSPPAADDATPAGPSAPPERTAATTTPLTVPTAPIRVEAPSGARDRVPVTVGPGGGYPNAIVGEVRNEQGGQVAGAMVTVERGEANPFFHYLNKGKAPPPIASAQADAEGRFRIPSLPPYENYVVSATHPDYAPASTNNIPVYEEGDSQAFLKMTPGYTLEGRVYGYENEPIAGASLVLDTALVGVVGGGFPRDTRETEADAQGSYRFPNVSMGQRTLTVMAAGYGSKTIPSIQFSGDNNVVRQDVHLQPGLTIIGQVVDEAGSAVPNVLIEATPYSSSEASHAQATTGPDGAFVLEALTPGTYAVQAKAEGYSNENYPRVEAGASDVLITLVAQASASGRVFARDSKNPIPSFHLEARKSSQPGAPAGRTGKEGSFNDPQGRFLFLGFDPGTYVLRATAPGYATAESPPFTVAKGQSAQGIDIALGPGGSIVGRVLEGRTGKPAGGATVRTRDNTFQDNPLMALFGPFLVTNLSDATARSGPDGRFALEHLMPGLYQIEVEHPTLTKKWVRDVQVSEGARAEVGDIPLMAGAAIRGVAVDGSGSPIRGGQVMVRPLAQMAGGMRNVRTDGAGRFFVANLPPGDYEVSVTPSQDPQPNPFQMILDIQKSKRPVTLGEGTEVEVNLFLQGGGG